MRVDYSTEEFMRPFHRNPNRQQALVQGCVAVTDVETDGRAWQAGVRSGTLISHVNDRHITSPREFDEAVAAASGKTVRLRIAGISPGEAPYCDVRP
jgi:S1-C subfamily serine protease